MEDKKYTIDDILKNNFYINKCIENNINKKFNIKESKVIKVFLQNKIKKILKTKPIFNIQITSSISNYSNFKTLIYTEDNIKFPDNYI